MTLLLHWDESRYVEETAALKSVSVPENALVLATDFSEPRRTLSRLIEARRRGETVALYPLLADPMEPLLGQVGAAIAQQTDASQRFMQLIALRDGRLNVNQKALHETAQYDPEKLRAAILFVKLCDVLLGFTGAEKERWAGLVGRPIRRFAYLPVPRCHTRAGGAPGVAVYCPEMSDAQLALCALALEERRVAATFVREHRAQMPAGTIVVPAWWRPARVLSLAAAGYRVAAPANGDPSQRCSCATYRPEDAFSFGAALDAALSSTPGIRFETHVEQTRAAIALAGTNAGAGPLVSVIVRTFDRPALLGRAIRSIVAQRYRSVEIVVVNNGGPDVEELVRYAAGTLEYRYVKLTDRSHISVASNAGARAARGTYVAYLDDDDLLYPDHLVHAVDALEASGADLVYTNCVAEYAQIDGERKDVLGFQIFRDSEFMPKELYLDNVAPIHSIVHRKDLFERFGYFDETFPVTDDWEMWLRASRGARFVHVDRVTCEYSWRFDPTRGNMTLTHQRQFAESYEIITSRYSGDVAGISAIAAQQAQVKAAQAQRAQQLEQLGPRMAELTIASMAQSSIRAEPAPVDPFGNPDALA